MYVYRICESDYIDDDIMFNKDCPILLCDKLWNENDLHKMFQDLFDKYEGDFSISEFTDYLVENHNFKYLSFDLDLELEIDYHKYSPF